jgi:hypothetical protein
LVARPTNSTLDGACARGVLQAELERRLLGALHRAAVHGLEVADRADRPFLQPLEGLRDESAGERERREPECDDGSHEERAAPLPNEVAPGEIE